MLHAFARSTLLIAVLTLSFHATAAQRTFVATSGSDANTVSNCSNTLPCRSFGSALTVTDSGGEIVVLTSGGYGPVTINKSVAIIAPEGIYAGISVSSGNGVTIATLGVEVVLRGLSINRLGGSGYGIHMTAGDSLTVQNCVITNFGYGGGLYVTGSSRVRLLDSLLRGNWSGAVFANDASALVSGSRFLDNSADGLYASASANGVVTKVEVTRSEASGNGGAGFASYAPSIGRTELNVKDSVVNRNEYGIYASGTSGTTLARVSNSLVSGNTYYGLHASGSGGKLVASGNKVTDNWVGLFQAGSAVLQSTGDNTVTDNTTATSGTITSLANM